MMTVDELMEMVRLARENCDPDGKRIIAAFPNLVKSQAIPLWLSSQIEEVDRAPQAGSR